MEGLRFNVNAHTYTSVGNAFGRVPIVIHLGDLLQLPSLWNGRAVFTRHPQARKPFTFCGSTWADGTPGPVAFCLPHGGIPGKLLKELNDEYRGTALFIMSPTDSHMMSAETRNSTI